MRAFIAYFVSVGSDGVSAAEFFRVWKEAMQVALDISVLLSTAFTGVIAGLFFAFSFSVMPALRRTRDEILVEVMQRINVAILNAWFLLFFVGALLATASSAALATLLGGGEAGPQIIAGFVLYLAVVVVTRVFNIRLNDELARVKNLAEEERVHRARSSFETPWVRWNNVRTALSLAAFLSMIWAVWLM